MALVQLGTTVAVGFGTFTYTGYVPEDGLTWKQPAGNVEEITDVHGAMQTKLIMDPRQEFGLSVIIHAAGTIVPPIQGATLAIKNPMGTTVTCMVNDATATFIRGATKLALDLVKEGSMTYS